MNRCTWVLLICGLAPRAHAGDNSPAPIDVRHFDRVIAPLLAARCLDCHSSQAAKGGLDLSRRERALRGGDSGPAIVAGNPGESLLCERIDAGEMPPKHPLEPAERQTLKSWIAAGAPWGADPIDRFRYTTASRAGYDWWSLQPLAAVRPPAVHDTAWPRNDVDRFILHRLEERGLTPAAAADPRTLVRRLYHDLIGLPPTPEEVAGFTAAPSQAAYERLVDGLLGSPQYGERWGRHWLDVVRFGESDGFERNEPRKRFWHYRDWVINSLNADMPYDRFVKLQLAGDLLLPGPAGAAAAGFLVAGVHNTVVGSSERMIRLARQDELEEIAAVVGQSFLGLTVNCARCHDHKFDPIPTTDYYRLISTLDGVNFGEREVIDPDSAAELAQVNRQIGQIQESLRAIDLPARQALRAERKLRDDSKPASNRVQPFAAWEFETDLRDAVGALHGTAHGGAHIADGALVLDGRGAFVQTAPLDRRLEQKTLEAWVALENVAQRGGGVIGVETNDGVVFDAIVFGEREPRHWMAGSDNFVRTKPFQGREESSRAAEPVHVAIVYRDDGTIAGYRNGAALGQPYQTGFMPFAAGAAHVVFGMRHAPAGGNKMLQGRILRGRLYDRPLTAEEIAASATTTDEHLADDVVFQSLPPEVKSRRAELDANLKSATEHRDRLDARSKHRMYTIVPGQPPVMRVHVRGGVTDLGNVAPPGGIAAIVGLSPEFGLAPDAPEAARRLRLADWVTNPANPLFARVMVNRVWHYHFGAGLVETPNDFGFNGARPSHPDLLDWLAASFRADGFRLKSLHRLIVTSAAYRQASSSNRRAFEIDAGNRLLWRFTPRRIEGETLRDAILKVAGALNPAAGGPGFEDVTITPNNGTTYYEAFDPAGPQFERRTIYRFTPRGGRSAVLDSFDCPDPATAAPRRSTTTTPLQALSLLNNSFILRMADRFAARVAADSGADRAAQVRRAWQLAVCRAPDAEEERLSLKLAEDYGLSALCRALFNLHEFVVVD